MNTALTPQPGSGLATLKVQVGLLATLQGLLLTNNVTQIAVNGLAGFALSSDKTWATLPITSYVLGAALCTMPASNFMRRKGRRMGYTVGACLAIFGALVSALAMHLGSMTLLCVGTFLAGIYNAFGSSLRFAAVDVAETYQPSFKPRAISLVLAGGIMGGIVGPELAKLTRTALPGLFSATYLVLAVAGLIALVLVQLLRVPVPSANVAQGPVRPLREIMRQPRAWVAVLAAMLTYGVMNLLMVATPLAMDICKLPFSSAALVLEWHVIGMFAPGLVTGSIIARFGTLPVMLVGCALMLVCTAIALSGVDLMNFLIALFVLGVGWNFMFTGATTLLTSVYRPQEKNRVQGFNDLCVFATMITTSLTSGIMLTTNGWNVLHVLAAPFVVVVVLICSWLFFHERRTGFVPA
jgi:MFS family permease